MSTNVVILTGRMAQDPRVSQVQGHSGPRTIANFSLAVRRNYKNQAGEYEADFIDCIVSGRQADNVANWTRKGSRVTVVGELKTRNYENNQGQRVYVTEVNVREVEFLDPRDQNQQGQNHGYGQQGATSNSRNKAEGISNRAEATSNSRRNRRQILPASHNASNNQHNRDHSSREARLTLLTYQTTTCHSSKTKGDQTHDKNRSSPSNRGRSAIFV